MRVHVTGGAGLIRSHLADARGDDVWVLDDLSMGRLENPQGLARHPRFHVQQGTVLDAPTVLGRVSRFDCVFHPAAAVGVQHVLENPLRSLRTNVRESELALKACAHGLRCRRGAPRQRKGG